MAASAAKSTRQGPLPICLTAAVFWRVMVFLTNVILEPPFLNPISDCANLLAFYAKLF
jgi:hypothetical protein